MGEGVTQELLQLLRGLSASLMAKLSQFAPYILQHKNWGAIAGFAIALLCTVKLFRAPGSQRHVDKRSAASSSQGDGSKKAVDDQQQTALTREELTVAQTVRRQLMGARKATCELLGVILQETSPEELQKHAVVRPAVMEVLLELAKACDFYLFARILDDESEENVMKALDAAGVFSKGLLDRNKVLFYGTQVGSSSFVRQLEPEWHIDSSADRTGQLARFVRYQLLISPPESVSATSPSNVFQAESVESYFGVPGRN